MTDRRYGAKLTVSVLQQRVDARHNGMIAVVGPYINPTTAMQFECHVCKHQWRARVHNVISTSGCPVCARTRQATNIGLGRRNSAKVLQQRWRSVQACESKYDIRCTTVELPDSSYTPLRWRCNTCDYHWMNTSTQLIKTEYGCPACGEIARIANSTALEAVQRRREKLLMDSYEVRRRILQYTCGRTTLITRWLGPWHPRRLRCNSCERTWVVRNGSDGMKTGVLCAHCVRRSGYSDIAISWLDAIAKENGIHICHARNGGEHRIPNTRWRADGYCVETHTVYEFHGDAWHGNPAVYAPHERCSPFNNARASALYRRTLAREKAIRDLGYNLVVMWEHDYRMQIAQQLS